MVPNLPAHIDFAYQTAQNLDHPILESHMGYFLLGSTSPDIRIITRRKREDYHFTQLDFENRGDSIEGMFTSYPELKSHSIQDEITHAFVAGYITHLIADERWIKDMYRRYFGNHSVFEDETFGKVMDRALQLELDHQSWNTVDDTLKLIENATREIHIGFISSETISDWQKWVVAFLSQGFSWNRLKFLARRIANGEKDHPAHEVAMKFVDAMPISLQNLYQTIPLSSMKGYRDQTIQDMTIAIGDYLP